jgi:hypothetical protein
MMKVPGLFKFFYTCLTAFLLVLAVFSCTPARLSSAPAPSNNPINATHEATYTIRLETTRLAYGTPTLAPSSTNTETVLPSPTPTITKTPSETPIPEPPRITILVTSACMYGPGSSYLYKYGLNATVLMTAIGRNEDSSWLNIKSDYDPITNACWIKATLVKFDKGKIEDIPIVHTVLPYSTLYQPPVAVNANRVGNEVTIFWQPVWMTEDDYRGYLVEAWVCQKGTRIFLPIGYVPSFDQNNSMMAIQITDEPGCDLPSSARIYSVGKHGYSDYRLIPWPGIISSASATPKTP